MRTCPECGKKCASAPALERHAIYEHRLTNRQGEWIFHPSARERVKAQHGYDGEDVPEPWRSWRVIRA